MAAAVATTVARNLPTAIQIASTLAEKIPKYYNTAKEVASHAKPLVGAIKDATVKSSQILSSVLPDFKNYLSSKLNRNSSEQKKTQGKGNRLENFLDQSHEELASELMPFFRSSIFSSTVFKEHLMQDPHINLILDDNWNVRPNFIHFVHFITQFISQLVLHNTTEQKCHFCSSNMNNKVFDEYTIDFYKNRLAYADLLNTYLNIDLTLAQQLFECIRPPCYPWDGTFGWDLNLFLVDRVKKMNRRINRPDQLLSYHGIIYKKDSDLSIAQKAAIVMSNYFEKNICRACFLYSTNDVFAPEHWCAYFVDFNCSKVFFYNSLAKMEQTDDRLCLALNYWINELNSGLPQFEFITNQDRLQGDSKLCGLFVYDFIYEMAKKHSEEAVDFFRAATKRKDGYLDSSIAHKMKNYIHQLSDANKSNVASFLNSLLKK